MKNTLFLLLFCFTMYGMETENAGSALKELDSGTKQVSWHKDVKEQEGSGLTPISQLKVPSLNSQNAEQDRSIVDKPKTIRMQKSPKEGRVLDKCCPACWLNDVKCCGADCSDGVKNWLPCYIVSGCAEECIRISFFDCCYDRILKEDNEIPEGKQEE